MFNNLNSFQLSVSFTRSNFINSSKRHDKKYTLTCSQRLNCGQVDVNALFICGLNAVVYQLGNDIFLFGARGNVGLFSYVM